MTVIYLIDEISPGERDAVRAHIASCSPCKERLAQERALIERMERHPVPEPGEAILQKSRLQLRENLRRERMRISAKDRLIQAWESLTFPRPAMQMVKAAAILVLGLVLGRFLPAGGDRTDLREAVYALSTSPSVNNFQVVPVLEKQDELEIRFRAVKEYSLRGSLHDPDIQYALAYALVNEPRDNIRLKSVNLLSQSPFEETVQAALVHAIEKDDNPGVRLKAIKLLRNLPINESIKRILVYALFQDPNAGVRTEAADALSETQDESVIAILQKRAQEDEYMQSLMKKISEERTTTTDSRSM